jgi:serine/threonine-protein kinase
MMRLQAGQLLGGKYRLIRSLGKGGMGWVWHAHHLTLNAPVALKLINAAYEDADTVQRFLGEARMAARLRSPHVVQILDYGVDDGIPHIAMELLEGESLAERLARVGRLSPAETARVVQHVVRAIARAHDSGIVHRDLKPENVFLVQNEDEEIAKVLDFGIAKGSAASLGKSAAAATRTGALLGTPYYMSPEQVDDVKAVDHRADIWALGVLAYRCLVGKLPFEGDGVGRVVLAICSHPIPIPSEHGPVPEGFDAWFARACARDASARYDSARRAGRELVAVCEGQPLSESTPALSASIARVPERAAAPGVATASDSAPGHTPAALVAGRSRWSVRSRRRVVVASALALCLSVVSAGIGSLITRDAERAAPERAPTAASPAPPAVLPPPPVVPEAPSPAPSASPEPVGAPAPAPSASEAARVAPAKPAGVEQPSRARPSKRAPQRNARERARTGPRRVPAEPSATTDLGI